MIEPEIVIPVLHCGYRDPEDGCCSHPKNITPECHQWCCPARSRLCFFSVNLLGNQRELFAEVRTIRQGPHAALVCSVSRMTWDLARRLADKLCDRYGIEDRAGLCRGRLMHVPS